MYNKLKYLKMVLSTILLSLMIISIFKSCSYAYTWSDFVEFSRQNTTNTACPNPIRNASSKFISNLDLIETRIASNGINLNDYQYFIAKYNSSWPYAIQMKVFNGPGTFIYNSREMDITGINGYEFDIYNLNNDGYLIQRVTQLINATRIYNTSDRVTTIWGLIYQYNDYGTYWLNNNFVPPVTLIFDPSSWNIIDIGEFTNTYIYNCDRSVTSWHIGEVKRGYKLH